LAVISWDAGDSKILILQSYLALVREQLSGKGLGVKEYSLGPKGVTVPNSSSIQLKENMLEH
jgi:hypothetical protein